MSRQPNALRQRRLALKNGRSAPPAFHGRLQMREMYFGSIDATDEIDSGGETALQDFYATFYVPPGLNLEAFLSGQSFLVYGLKGTGKTSFLRYFAEHLDRHGLGASELWRFSRDFPAAIYDDVRKMAGGPGGAVHLEKEQIFLQLDYEDVWRYILLKRVEELIRDRKGIFRPGPELDEFVDFITSIKPSSLTENIYRYLPNVTGNLVTLKRAPKAAASLEFADDAALTLTFRTFIKHCLALYGRLLPGEHRFYLLLDEIEPRLASGALFEMDLILIRDLVNALRHINTIHSREKKRFYFVAGIRSEVLTRVKQLGKETHKHLEQYGFCMNWGDQGRVSVNHPLIKMLCEKIAYSERSRGIAAMAAQVGAIEEYIWPRYFRKNNREQLEPKVVLDLTWYRPRDLVRLCQIITEIAGDAEVITESLIGRAKKRYAENSWAEIESQLAIALDPFEILGLEAVLTSFKTEFTLEELDQRIARLAKIDNHVERLKRKHDTTDVIRALYQNGAVGDFVKGRNRFAFRGDGEPNVEGTILVHKGLLSRFTLKREAGASTGQRPSTQAPKTRNRF